MKSLAAFTVVIAACTLPVVAEPSLECSLRSSSQVEIADCLAEDEEIANAALDVVLDYARAAAVELDAVTERSVAVAALEASQTAWDTHRQAHCAYRGALFGGGTGTGIEVWSCRIEMTRARIKALQVALR